MCSEVKYYYFAYGQILEVNYNLYFQLSSQGWLLMLRAYKGSGMDVYNTWMTGVTDLTKDTWASPILVQDTVWNLVKQVT